MGSLHHELVEKARHYHLPEPAAKIIIEHPPLIVAGATASGKNSVVKQIEQTSDYKHVITHTTRQPRADEVVGENYWFVSEEHMLQMILEQQMIEVNAIHGNTVYGASIAAYEQIISQGKKPLLIIDVQGVKDITMRLPTLEAVFILPPNFDTWMHRLDSRGAMSAVERHRRLRSAQIEIEDALKSRHFRLVVNHDVARTSDEILQGRTDIRTQRQNRELAERLLDHIRHF